MSKKYRWFVHTPNGKIEVLSWAKAAAKLNEVSFLLPPAAHQRLFTLSNSTVNYEHGYAIERQLIESSPLDMLKNIPTKIVYKGHEIELLKHGKIKGRSGFAKPLTHWYYVLDNARRFRLPSQNLEGAKTAINKAMAAIDAMPYTFIHCWVCGATGLEIGGFGDTGWGLTINDDLKSEGCGHVQHVCPDCVAFYANNNDMVSVLTPVSLDGAVILY